MTVLRGGLLRDRAIALAGGVPSQLRDALVALGASTEEFVYEPGDDGAGERWASSRAPLHALLYDARPPFGEGGQVGLRSAVEQGWIAIRAVASGALIPARAGGKIVLVAPPPDAGPYAEAARSALENLARTLSVEWARHGVTTTMIAPGKRSTADELALLVCFLFSAAGDYFSGCRLELGRSAP